MTKEERQEAILADLMRQGAVQVSDLSAQLEVSSVTIRKDLTELEKEGKLYRSHGKAILINPFMNNRSVSVKEKLNTEEKQHIGAEAAKLIVPNDSIVMASGSTIHALAGQIKPQGKLIVVTAALQVTQTLTTHDNVEVVQLGGSVRHSSLSVVGKSAEETLGGCSFSKLFLGVDGIDVEFGLSTTDMREAELNRVMMEKSQKTIVLADSSKFGKRGFAKICNLEDIDMIITDRGIPDSTRRQIEELGIEIMLAN